MSYDTGCDAIMIHANEVSSFVQPGMACWCLYQIPVTTATGTALQCAINVQVRAVDSNQNVLRDWVQVPALVLGSTERIGSAPLKGVFACIHGNGQHLYCARNKTALLRCMPP